MLFGRLIGSSARHRAEIDRVVTMANQFAAEVEDTARSSTARGSATLILMGLVAAAVVAIIGWLIIRSIVNPINMLTLAAKKLMQGDIDQRVDHRSADETGILAESFRGMMTTIKSLMAETGRLVTAAKQGRLDQRGDVAAFAGAYRQLVQGFNETLDAVVQPINEASTVLEQVAARNLTPRVCGEYLGDHGQIKSAVNGAIDNLEEALARVTVGAEQVTAAATQISKGSQSLAQGASEQASSLEEASSSLEQMSSMT